MIPFLLAPLYGRMTPEDTGRIYPLFKYICSVRSLSPELRDSYTKYPDHKPENNQPNGQSSRDLNNGANPEEPSSNHE